MKLRVGMRVLSRCYESNYDFPSRQYLLGSWELAMVEEIHDVWVSLRYDKPIGTGGTYHWGATLERSQGFIKPLEKYAVLTEELS